MTGRHRGLPERWNATVAEAEASYPCDRLVDGPYRAIIRAIDVDAPPQLLYRWVCQLRAAPYSYDLLDNLGRRSPRTLTPGLDELALGQTFQVAEIVDFAYGEHVTGLATPAARRIFGLEALTYATVDRGDHRSRLVVRMNLVEPRSAWEHARHRLLAWGDLGMMRKQLLTLRDLAERDGRHARVA